LLAGEEGHNLGLKFIIRHIANILRNLIYEENIAAAIRVTGRVAGRELVSYADTDTIQGRAYFTIPAINLGAPFLLGTRINES
jgi:hypothetical protein